MNAAFAARHSSRFAFFVQEILGGVYKASWKNILKQQKRKFLVKIHS